MRHYVSRQASATRKLSLLLRDPIGGNNLLRRNNKCVVDGGLVPLVSLSLYLSANHTSFTPRVRAGAAYRTVHTQVFSVSPRFMSLDGRADLEDRSFLRTFVCPLSRAPRCRTFWPSFARLLRPDKYLARPARLVIPPGDILVRKEVCWIYNYARREEFCRVSIGKVRETLVARTWSFMVYG